MKRLLSTSIVLLLSFLTLSSLYAKDITLKISKKYLNLPVARSEERAKMSIQVNGKPERTFVIRLASDEINLF